MRARTLMAFAALLVMTTIGASGQAKPPNFTGEWTIVAEKSDFGPMPKPDKLVRTITHNDPVLKIVTVQSGAQGEMTSEATYTTDGKPAKNTLQGNPVTTTAKWEGSTLVMSSTMTMQEVDIPIADRIDVSPDGNTMTLVRNIEAPQGTITVTLVLAKK